MATRTEPIDFLAGGVALAIGVQVVGATQGSLLFVGPAFDLQEDNSNLFWDNTSKRLGLLTAAPSDTLHVAAGGTVRIEDITEGSVLFAGADGVLSQDNVGLFFDPTLNRLGIGTITPGQHITISESDTSFPANILLVHTATSGPGTAQIGLSVNSGSTGDPLIQFLVGGGQSWVMGVDNSGGDSFVIATGAVLGTTNRFVINSAGLVSIGAAGPTTILDITQDSASMLFRMVNSATASTGNLVVLSHFLNSTTASRPAVQMLSSFADITDGTRTAKLEWRTADNGVFAARMAFVGGDLGIGQLVPARRLHLELDDGSVGSVSQLLRLTHTTTGTPVAGIGVGMEFEVETGIGNNEIGATIEALTTDVGAGTEDFDLVFSTMAAGATAAERMRITSAGNVLLTDIEIDGDLNHDGSDVGFYGTAPIALQTGVAVSAAGVHAALVNLGLITA